MNKKSDFWSRMKQQPLSFWGALCIFAGIFSMLLMNMMLDASELRRSELRASQLGSAIGGGLIVLVGIVLLAVHFLSGKRRG